MRQDNNGKQAERKVKKKNELEDQTIVDRLSSASCQILENLLLVEGN